MLTRYDKILLFFLISLAIFSFVVVIQVGKLSGEGRQVVIVSNGEEVVCCDLSVDRKVEVQGFYGKSVVEIREGKVKMVSSACPNKICVKQGWIEKPNQIIVCAPNKVLVKITGNQNEEFLDAVSR